MDGSYTYPEPPLEGGEDVLLPLLEGVEVLPKPELLADVAVDADPEEEGVPEFPKPELPDPELPEETLDELPKELLAGAELPGAEPDGMGPPGLKAASGGGAACNAGSAVLKGSLMGGFNCVTPA